MTIIERPELVTDHVARARKGKARVGFVPTMGALHTGHAGLIQRARETCDLVVCSIFVNPLQFNDPQDLQRYPRSPQQDKAMLEKVGCDLLFMPAREDLFSDFQPITYDLGGLDNFWEGPSRPGHFQGVVNVVERLFFFVRADEAFFGEKDRQQLAILEHVARTLHWPERLVPCPTAREESGLAMSSRNLRLSTQERQQAAILYRGLNLAATLAFEQPVQHVIEAVARLIETAPGVTLDHFGLADADSLHPLDNWEGIDKAIAMIAAYVGPVRLIDNITITRK